MTLPAELRSTRIEELVARFTGSNALSAPALAACRVVFACSEYVLRRCEVDPQMLVELDHSGALHAPLQQERFVARLKNALAPAGQGPADAQMRGLRETRQRECVRIAFRDLAGWAGVDETLAELSLLAETLTGVAAGWAQSHVQAGYGVLRAGDDEPQPLIVVAMGKLGGRELNFSSDIDLVLLFPRAGESDGPRQLDGGRYFTRVGQQLIRLLDESTADGFVYRVDVRLRPFGSSGALALSFAAFEAYLQQHGRDWERYAYVKARPITGDEGHRQAFSELVRPFVFRRYLDFGVLESLREMKALVAADVERRDRRNDVKLGPGGIREIEFIVQALQMLRGGANPALRTPSLLEAMAALEKTGWLPAQAASELAVAYRFLRRVENHLQAWRDEQVHIVTEADRPRLAFSMQCQSRDDFEKMLARHRATVARHFRATVYEARGDSDKADALEPIWHSDPGARSATAAFEELGYADAQALQTQLSTLRAGGQYRRLDQRGRERVDVLVPRIVRVAAGRRDPDAVVRRLLRIVGAVGQRSAYFALLIENPAVLGRLADLAASSPWVARRVAERPILLDELIDPRLFEIPPARADFRADLEQRFDGIKDDDLERQMDALREFQQAAVFRVAVADLAGVLPLMRVSDRLTDIAELVLDKVIELAANDIARRHGQPLCGEPGAMRRAGFAVIGYGKLGGLELGYASDLDIVLIHDSEGAVQLTDGAQPIDNSRYFVRLGQRVLHMLATTTLSGVLYEVDTRLRPSGKAGPLVSSLEAFAKYQRSSAWTWEHQALLRARGVAGDSGVIATFEQLRLDVLTEQHDEAELRARVADMRARMRRELPGGGPDAFDIKRDAGGLTDIEFIVQYLVLAHAARHPRLVRYSDNIRQLENLADAALLEEADAAELADIYRRYRQRLHRLALADAPGIVDASEFEAERAAIQAYWAIVFAD